MDLELATTSQIIQEFIRRHKKFIYVDLSDDVDFGGIAFGGMSPEKICKVSSYTTDYLCEYFTQLGY